jgi:uncharacterized phage-associated protein
MQFDYVEQKTTELILYIALVTESDAAAGAIKLNKIPYFADLAHLRHYGKPITGAAYQKLEQGPALRPMLRIIERLEADGSAKTVTRDYYGHRQKRLMALREPDLSLFTAEEIATVDSIVRQFWGVTATEISKVSHDDAGWNSVEEGQAIPYSMAFIGEPEITEEVTKRARELAEQA